MSSVVVYDKSFLSTLVYWFLKLTKMERGTKTKHMIEVNRERALAYFRSEIPCYIVKFNGDWRSGYILCEPGADLFYLMDPQEPSTPVPYIDIKKFEEYKGDISKLPKPTYLQMKEMHKELAEVRTK